MAKMKWTADKNRRKFFSFFQFAEDQPRGRDNLNWGLEAAEEPFYASGRRRRRRQRRWTTWTSCCPLEGHSRKSKLRQKYVTAKNVEAGVFKIFTLFYAEFLNHGDRMSLQKNAKKYSHFRENYVIHNFFFGKK
jgi:hypothetical protein